MTDKLEILRKIHDLLGQLDEGDLRISCCTRCGDHPVELYYLGSDHLTLCPDIDKIAGIHYAIEEGEVINRDGKAIDEDDPIEVINLDGKSIDEPWF